MASNDNCQPTERITITPVSSNNCQPIAQSDSMDHITLASDSSEVTGDTRRSVIGLLASTALRPNHWQVTDFVALYALLDCLEENSSWFCGEEIRNGPGFLLGDPSSNGIIFEPPAFEQIFDTVEPVGKIRKLVEFRCAYLQRIRDCIPWLNSRDTLFLVICGRGSDQGTVFLGNAYNRITLHPAEMECALEDCVAKVYLITTTGFSDSWKSQRWTLIAPGVDKEAVSIVESDSGHFRGGLFTRALLAEHANLHEHIGTPRQEQRHLMPLLPHKRTSDLLKWFHQLQDDMGQTDFPISPRREDDTFWKLLLASDLTSSPTIQQNDVQPPSSQAAPASGGDSLPNLQNKNEKVLLSLARDHLQFAPPETLSEVCLVRNCNALVNDQHHLYGSLTAEEKAETLKVLRQRHNYRFLAYSIARKLGWQDAVITVGYPFDEQRQQDHNLSLQARAADHGYLFWNLHVLQFNTLWKGVAGWLARVWEAAGEPTIDARKWKETLEDCCEFTGITLDSVP